MSEPTAHDAASLVSVLVPLYNHESTVERSLDSILKSNCENVELVISDDGSSDSSADVASSWVERNGHRFAATRLIRQEKNLGITGNLNFLIATCRGAYLTALGSDDELIEGAVDVQRDFLNLHDDKDFVFANVVGIDDEGSEHKTFLDSSHIELLHSPICCVFDAVLNWSMPWGRLFARSAAIRAFGPYIEAHAFEDRWSGLKIVQTGRYGFLNKVVYRYRVRASGTGTAGLDSARLLRDWWDVERRLVSETTGLIRALLWIRVHSVTTRGDLRRPIFWRVIHAALTRTHRAVLRLRIGLCRSRIRSSSKGRMGFR